MQRMPELAELATPAHDPSARPDNQHDATSPALGVRSPSVTEPPEAHACTASKKGRAQMEAVRGRIRTSLSSE